MRKRFNGKAGNVLLTCVTVGALAVAGVSSFSAYLTDNEQTTNTFTVGKVQVDLEEPNYPGNASEKVKNLEPNQEVAKDPKVENTGKNTAIVFTSVSVPVKKIVVATADGTRGTEGMSELFQTKNATGFGFGNVNNNWLLLKTEYLNSAGAVIKNVTGDIIPDTAVSVLRTYGYSEKVTAGSTTNTLFDKVKLVNVIEGYADSTVQDIEIKTYAIQSDDITDVPTSTLNTTTLTKVYDVYMNQNVNTANKDADTANKKNLNGKTLNTYTTRVTASIDNAVIAVGDTAQMTSTVDDQDAKAAATYTSDDATIASVDASTGVVTGEKAGTTKIKATYNGVSSEVTVTVKAAKSANQVTSNTTTK